jgi:hypothetical protein
VRLAILLFGATLISACGWDWTVRSTDDTDASATNDAGTDGPISDSGAADVTTPTDASDCTALLANVASTKAQAITCTLGSVTDCVSEVMDECGCGVFVGQNASTASQNFANAVGDAKSAGCTSQCSGCTALPARGTCVEQGTSFLCSPP